MGQNSKIQWTDHTFNPWRGCTKVSDGCRFCYAETQSKRNPGVLGEWGPKGSRVIASEAMWGEPDRWNAAAKLAGVRRRVFCASLADVFEGNDTMPHTSWLEVEAARKRLFSLIEQTTNLDWLLLTKRPENVTDLVPHDWQTQFPDNVWMGTSIEDQPTADKRIPNLRQIPAKVRFLSMEPLLGLVNLCKGCPGCPNDCGWMPDRMGGGIHWGIVGGESGTHARPFDIRWARSLVKQFCAANVPLFVKQWGSNPVKGVVIEDNGARRAILQEIRLQDKKGGDRDEWEPDLRVRQFPRLEGVTS